MSANANTLPEDPTVYPVEDDVGEHELQMYILELLRPMLEEFLGRAGRDVHVGSDQFIYWRQYEPTCSVSPDIYVLPGVPQDFVISSWKVWEHKVVPSFALEVVTLDRRKDYEEAPKRYNDLGVQELVIFDPFPGPERVTFQVFRRSGQRLTFVERSDGDRVYSESLGCWLRVVGKGERVRLRIAIGERGEELVPTPAESTRQARIEAQRARAQAEQARAQAEQAQARIAELEAALTRLTGER